MLKSILPVGTVVLSLTPAALAAEPTLAPLFTDHMVLQQGQANPVWGQADPGTEVRVAIGGQEHTATAGDDGTWRVDLEPLEAGGPYTLEVEAGDAEWALDDVLVGEVWIASGQSNMEWTVGRSQNAEEEIAAADYPGIRMFTVKKRVAGEPQTDADGTWEPASPETVGRFSGVGYFFARDLHKELGVPVGIVHTSWGGTPAESWTSREALESSEITQPILTRFDKALEDYPRLMEEYRVARAEWEKNPQVKPMYQSDPGDNGAEQGYATTGFDDGDWKTMEVPGAWERQEPATDGAFWFRRTVEIPQGWAGRPLQLELGAIDDFDTTYVNGQPVGSTGEETANFWIHPRVYDVPAELVEGDEVTVAVRVFDRYGDGGLLGPDGTMRLYPKEGDPEEAVSLGGEWRYKVEVALSPDDITGPGGGSSRGPREPQGPEHPWRPAGLYNAMLHPLMPYGIRGAIWYQGESNAGRAEQYRTLFPMMIEDWRERWGEGEFPFLFVQLANYQATTDQPQQDGGWPHLREAQFHTLRTVPNTGMATIIDIGDAGDVHPRNKQDVGHRLARWALADTYGQDVVKSGPLYAAAERDGNAMVIRFESVGDGLEIRGNGELQAFAAATEGGNFQHARAEITGDDTVRVTLPSGEPVAAVRYAWANNPDKANLVNSEDLPASPFRTDDRPGPTDGNR